MISLADQIAAVRKAAEKVNPQREPEHHEALFEALLTLQRTANERHSFRRVKDLERVVRDQATHIRGLEGQLRPHLVTGPAEPPAAEDAVLPEVIEGQESMLP